MFKWEQLEVHLFDREALGEEFNCPALADDLGITRREATSLIQCYLSAQRRPNSRTLFVISRQGRTAAAVWHVGVRSRDVRLLTRQCLSDMGVKVTASLEPDLRRMAGLNPRCSRLAEAMTNAFAANLKLLAAGLDGE